MPSLLSYKCHHSFSVVQTKRKTGGDDAIENRRSQNTITGEIAATTSQHICCYNSKIQQSPHWATWVRSQRLAAAEKDGGEIRERKRKRKKSRALFARRANQCARPALDGPCWAGKQNTHGRKNKRKLYSCRAMCAERRVSERTATKKALTKLNRRQHGHRTPSQLYSLFPFFPFAPNQNDAPASSPPPPTRLPAKKTHNLLTSTHP